MTAHDPCCCLDDMPGPECPVCASIALARGEERTRYDRTWKDNLPSIARRHYVEGYRDATNGRPMRYYDQQHDTP
jgi:hypothetical protein